MNFASLWINSLLYCLRTRLILLSSLWFATYAVSLCLPHQRSALLQLKQGFSHYDLILPSWIPGTDCCHGWEGVSCNESTGHVTVLDLSERHIEGNLSAVIFNLTSLQYLNLAYNDFTLNSIPAPGDGFEKLTMLTHLNLSYTILYNQVPVSITNLTNLVLLDLSAHVSLVQLQYPNLRALVSNMGNLRELHLDGVSVYENGTEWCGALSESLPLLQVLSMINCNLLGPIEPSLAQLNSLAVIHLSWNSFNSPLPDYFADFPLKDLQLSDCNITGSFPRKIFQIPTLTILDLSYNEDLHVTIPDFPIGSSLEILYLNPIIISDQIPDSIGNLRNLSQLYLQACNFSGQIPSSITKLAKLELLDLSDNALSGTIPQGLFSLPNLKELHLQNNTFSGEFILEEQHSNWSSPLTKLDLSGNQLNGPIPQAMYKFPNLQALHLSSNQFNGPIPNSLFGLSSLSELYLSSNKFNGTIDLSLLQHLTNLTDFYLSDNQLFCVEDVSNEQLKLPFPKIKYFGLASCELKKIPHLLRYQNAIVELDLSSNQLDGVIASWLWGVFGPDNEQEFYSTSLNLSRNMFTGVDVPPCDPLENCQYLITIDLSYNKIRGALPLIGGFFLDYSNNELSEIPSNYTLYLDDTGVMKFSKNKLMGEIPSSICNMSNLSFLDFSVNNLSGLVPPCIFLGTRNLQFLNLASNKFHGTIPHNVSVSCPLVILDLSDNNLDGNLPRSLTRCKFLMLLNIRDNDITDTFPFWLWELPDLQIIILRSNRFYGTLELSPKFVNNNSLFENLRIIDLASNNFNGTLPPSLFKNFRSMANSSLNELTTEAFIANIEHIFYGNYGIDITNKGILMSLEESIASLMVEIDLSNNKFIGYIPEVIGELSALKALNLSHNALTGSIPRAFKGLTQIESLDMSFNSLSGEIPQELTSMDFLAVLNFSFNHLVGKIPEFHKPFENSSFEENPELCGAPLTKKCYVPSPENNSTTTPTTATIAGKMATIVALCIFIGIGFGTGFAIVIVWPVIKRAIIH